MLCSNTVPSHTKAVVVRNVVQSSMDNRRTSVSVSPFRGMQSHHSPATSCFLSAKEKSHAVTVISTYSITPSQPPRFYFTPPLYFILFGKKPSSRKGNHTVSVARVGKCLWSSSLGICLWFLEYEREAASANCIAGPWFITHLCFVAWGGLFLPLRFVLLMWWLHPP